MEENYDRPTFCHCATAPYSGSAPPAVSSRHISQSVGVHRLYHAQFGGAGSLACERALAPISPTEAEPDRLGYELSSGWSIGPVGKPGHGDSVHFQDFVVG